MNEVWDEGCLYHKLSDNEVELIECNVKDESFILPTKVEGDLYIVSVGSQAFIKSSAHILFFDGDSMIEKLDDGIFDGSKLLLVQFPKKVHVFGENFSVNYGVNPRIKFIVPEDSMFLIDFDGLIYRKNPLELIYANGNRKHVHIRESVRCICSRAFSLQTTLKSISLPSSVSSIGSYSFYATHLKNIIISPYSQFDSINEYSFSGTFLSSFKFPASVKFIKKGAFSRCGSLQKIEFSPNSKLMIIEMCSFSQTPLNRIIFPSSLEEIGEQAFSFCNKLKLVQFANDSKLKFMHNTAFIYATENLKFKYPHRLKSVIYQQNLGGITILD